MFVAVKKCKASLITKLEAYPSGAFSRFNLILEETEKASIIKRQPSLISKSEPTQVLHFQVLGLYKYARLDLNGLPGTNTLAYLY